MRQTAPAKSVAPKTSIRGGGTKNETKTATSSTRRSPCGAVVAGAGLAGGEHAAGVGEHGVVEPGVAEGAVGALGRDDEDRPDGARPADDDGERDRLVGEHAVERGPSRAWSAGCTSDVEDAAAGQPDGEGVVVAVAVALPLGLAAASTSVAVS